MASIHSNNGDSDVYYSKRKKLSRILGISK
jgi:hypothetical protein